MPVIGWQPAEFLFGGSSGTVVSGAMGWLTQHGAQDLTAVAIAPDFGERYLDTVYQKNWVMDLYGEDVLSSDELTPVCGPPDPGALHCRRKPSCRDLPIMPDSPTAGSRSRCKSAGAADRSISPPKGDPGKFEHREQLRRGAG